MKANESSQCARVDRMSLSALQAAATKRLPARAADTTDEPVQ